MARSSENMLGGVTTRPLVTHPKHFQPRRQLMITNQQSGTRIDEIAAGIFRINTPVALPGDMGFNFNQYLIVDEAPMVFHTGLRGTLSARERGDPRRDADREAPLRRALAFRGRRVRRAELVPCGRAERGPGLQPARRDGLRRRLRRPRAARARRRRGALARVAQDPLVRHAARAARVGVRAHDGRRRRARSSAATCSRRAARARSRSPSRTSSGRARRSVSRWTITRTRRRRARRSSASRARRRRRSQ